MPRAEQSAGNRLAVARLPPRPGVADFKSKWPTSNRKRRPTSPGICINASRQFLRGRQRRAAAGLVSRASRPGVRRVRGASGGRSEAAWYDPVLARRLAPAQSSARLPALGRAFEGWFQVVLLPRLLPGPSKPRGNIRGAREGVNRRPTWFSDPRPVYRVGRRSRPISPPYKTSQQITDRSGVGHAEVTLPRYIAAYRAVPAGRDRNR